MPVVLFAPSLAFAAEIKTRRTEAVVLVDGGDSAAATRIVAELQASGLRVVTTQGPQMTPAELERIARSAEAAAVVDIEPETGNVSVWTGEGPTLQLVLRSVIPLDGGPAVVGLRTAEALRGTFHEPNVASTTGAQPRKREGRPARAGTPSELGVSLGAAFAIGGGQFSGSWQGQVTLQWLWVGRWGVEAAGVFPLSSEHRSSTEGSAELTFGFVVGGARGRLIATSWGSLDVSVGAGAAAIHTRGFPSAADISATERLSWVATPYGRISYGLTIAGPLRARADLIGIVLVPRPLLVAGDATAWGVPLLLVSGGLELAFR